MLKSSILASSLLLAASPLLAHDDLGVGYHWSVLTEFVYMNRTQLHSHSIVDKYAPGTTCPCFEKSILHTKRLIHDFDFEPGFRAGIGYQPNDYWSAEASFLYLNEWEGEAEKHGNGDLSFPGYISVDGFNQADRAEGNYKSRFYNAELNASIHLTPRKVDYFSYSWIVGLRYVYLRETFGIHFFTGENRSVYDVHARNILGGPQMGGMLEWNPMRQLTWGFAAKFAALADRCEQKTYVAADNNTNVLRHYTKQKWAPVFLADVAASVGFQATSHFNVHAGYQMIYLTGVALAPEQISKSTNMPGHHHLNTHGNALIHGLFAGLLFTF